MVYNFCLKTKIDILNFVNSLNFPSNNLEKKE